MIVDPIQAPNEDIKRVAAGSTYPPTHIPPRNDEIPCNTDRSQDLVPHLVLESSNDASSTPREPSTPSLGTIFFA